MPDPSERFAVLIPAFNAEKTLGAVIRGCKQQVPDIIVVDDGSRDRTSDVAADEGAVALRHALNCGKGRALKTGFAWALEHGFDGVIVVDADGQHLPSEIPKLLRCRAETGADLVIGGRSHLFDQMLPRRRLANRFSTWAIGQLSRTGVSDSQCGFRVYSAKLLRSFELRTDGFDAESEILVRAGLAGMKVATTPIEMGFVDGLSTSHFRPLRDTLRIAWTVARARFFWR
ncbi:MAG TPA: glycosyltransferase family 2 protein [Thermoanaerobaculia bacterium]|nr:glycosyltransferase family 2 protein [Thermoanaerobaculia bacterium]